MIRLILLRFFPAILAGALLCSAFSPIRPALGLFEACAKVLGGADSVDASEAVTLAAPDVRERLNRVERSHFDAAEAMRSLAGFFEAFKRAIFPDEATVPGPGAIETRLRDQAR